MLIFPWSNLSNEAYIKLDNFKIDSKLEDIDRDLSIIPWVFNQGDAPLAPSKHTIHPQTSFDKKDYSLIEADLYVGIQLNEMEDRNKEKYNFYIENSKKFNANVIINSKKSMTKISYPLTLCDIKKNDFNDISDEIRYETKDDLIWKTTVKIPKEYFGLDFTISPSFELLTNETEESRVYSGGETKYSESWIRINFNETDPIIKNGQKIELQKVYFSTGEVLDSDKKVDIEKKLKHEEWWLSTEIDNDEKPYGFVNIDIESLREIMEESPEGKKNDWFYNFKRFKQDELAAGVWKVVLHTTLVKIFKNALEEIENNDDKSKEDVVYSVYEDLPDFDKSALGFFSKKITLLNGSTDSAENASLEVIREIIEEGPERNVALMSIEIEKFIDIKKSTELVWESKQEEEEESGDVWID